MASLADILTDVKADAADAYVDVALQALGQIALDHRDAVMQTAARHCYFELHAVARRERRTEWGDASQGN
jgi:hypothetical protein